MSTALPSFPSLVRTALRKDLLVQWRTRLEVSGVIVFGFGALLALSFAAGPDPLALRRNAAAALWVALLFTSSLALAASFRAERTGRALEGVLLLPAPARALFLGKALANGLQLLLVGLALLPGMVALFDAAPHRFTELLPLLLILALGSAALSAPGTFFAAMASEVSGQQLLLPLLLFPLAVPVLLASIRATELTLNGDPMGQLPSWLGLLLVFNVVFWPLSGWLFRAVVEECG